MSQNENAAQAAGTRQLRPMEDTEAEKIVGGTGSDHQAVSQPAGNPPTGGTGDNQNPGDTITSAEGE